MNLKEKKPEGNNFEIWLEKDQKLLNHEIRNYLKELDANWMQS